jgi:DNA mismatch endonuclease (patch repair protein)
MTNQGAVSGALQHPTTPKRSLLMARIRRSGTAPELALRTALHRAGYRYRLKSGIDLPGKPDVVLRRFSLAIFVDGCFWHGCEQHGSTAKTNADFWNAKILRNRQRDKKVDQALDSLGWKVLRVWEHEVRLEMPKILRRVQRLAKS